MRYRLADRVELRERNNEHLLVCAAPLSVLRLNRPLRELVSRCQSGPVEPATPAEGRALEQLAGKGFMERLRSVEPGRATNLPTVSIVIPVKDREEELVRCLDSLSRIDYPKDKLQVIVVDDGSSDRSPELAIDCGATVVPSGGTGRGPAAARNVGAGIATGEILAFIDSDCTASPEWLCELIPAFDNPLTAAVGGFVDGMCRESAVDKYESVMSSLSLGSRERTGSSGDDTFYLPSCNLLVRRELFHGVGGFRDEMHVGEDVDLTWRLRDQGWSIGYIPAGRVFHEHRSSVRSFMSRRFDYGTSEGALQMLHPLRRKRMVIPPLLASVLALCLMAPFTGFWSLLAAGVLLAADTLHLRMKVARRGLPLGLFSLFTGRLRALGSLAYYLSFHLVRYYLIPLVVVSLFVPLLCLLPVAALLCASGVDYAVKKPGLPYAVYAGIYFLEQLAYGAGVFCGCLSRKTFASYRVVLLRQAVAG